MFQDLVQALKLVSKWFLDTTHRRLRKWLSGLIGDKPAKWTLRGFYHAIVLTLFLTVAVPALAHAGRLPMYKPPLTGLRLDTAQVKAGRYFMNVRVLDKGWDEKHPEKYTIRDETRPYPIGITGEHIGVHLNSIVPSWAVGEDAHEVLSDLRDATLEYEVVDENGPVRPGEAVVDDVGLAPGSEVPINTRAQVKIHWVLPSAPFALDTKVNSTTGRSTLRVGKAEEIELVDPTKKGKAAKSRIRQVRYTATITNHTGRTLFANNAVWAGQVIGDPGGMPGDWWLSSDARPRARLSPLITKGDIWNDKKPHVFPIGPGATATFTFTTYWPAVGTRAVSGHWDLGDPDLVFDNIEMDFY
ncbi:MAG: hypothetical protein CVT67_02770 [Actinobacteria bacterium HGW-Actinobacteria-7]|jgi:hypothetical protein|nr:MAG: hypothetical protein CVT67_02770 [Actinobacteria bacterium HGW-Actinobacteria-7]